MTATMTEKQRQAVAALEAARSEGCSLTQYAQANGLDVQKIYAILAMLRRRGLLPKSERRRRNRFVAVRVQPTPLSSRAIASAAPAAVATVCRIVGQHGVVIECLQSPEPRWVAALSAGSTDAAP
jgi:DNA-binding IclR family transcriptional regulator